MGEAAAGKAGKRETPTGNRAAEGSPGAGPSRLAQQGAAEAATAPTGAAGADRPVSGAVAPPLAMRFHQFIACLGMLTHLAITVAGWKNAATAGRVQTLVILAAAVAWAASSVLIPHFFWRHRLPLLSLARIAVALVPSFRQTGVGASLVLERPPQAGWLGAAADLGRIISGTRLLGVAVGGAAIPLPVGVTLATQIVLLFLTANSPAYCSTQLLAAPLTRRRAAAVAAVLEAASLPVLALLAATEPAGLPGQPTALQRQEEPGNEVCRATLLMLQASLGVLLPTLLAAYWRQPAEAAVEEGEEHAASAADEAAAGSPAGFKQAWKAASGRVSQAALAVDGALAAALRSASTVRSRAALAWFLLSLCWAVCKRQAGLPLLL